MKNRNFIIGLSVVGFSLQAFTLISNDALNSSYADAFNAVSTLILFSAFIAAIWSMPCARQKEEEREELFRDFDASYRYIDDQVRTLREEIRDCQRNSESACKYQKK